MSFATKVWQTTKALPGLISAAWKGTYNLQTAPLSEWWQGLTALWSSPGYSKLAKKAHQNPYASRGLRLIAQTMASVPLTAIMPTDDRSSAEGGERPDTEHPVLKLLDRPNPRQTHRHFFDAAINHLYCGGEMFVEQRGPQTRQGPPRRLYLHEPNHFLEFIRQGDDRAPSGFEERLSAETRRQTAEGDVIGYWMRSRASGPSGRGKRVAYTIDQMHHIRIYNPAEPDRGLPLLLGAARAVQAMEAADQWNLSLSTNAGRIPGHFSPKNLPDGAQLSEDQVKRAEENLGERVKERQRVNLPMVLSGAFEFVGGVMKPKDADWLESDKNNARKVAAVLGVSARLLGDEKAGSLTDSGIDSEMKALYLLTVLPLLDFILDELNVWLAPLYSDDLKLGYDLDQVEALQEDMTQKYRRYKDACGVPFLSPDEAREALGYEPEGGAGAERHVPLGMQPAAAETPENGTSLRSFSTGDGRAGEPPRMTSHSTLRSLKSMREDEFAGLLHELAA